MLLLLLAAFAAIISLEVPGLVKKKMWRELVVFSVYLSVGMALSIPQVLGARLPDPNKIIESLFLPLSKLLLR